MPYPVYRTHWRISVIFITYEFWDTLEIRKGWINKWSNNILLQRIDWLINFPLQDYLKDCKLNFGCKIYYLKGIVSQNLIHNHKNHIMLLMQMVFSGVNFGIILGDFVLQMVFTKSTFWVRTFWCCELFRKKHDRLSR